MQKLNLQLMIYGHGLADGKKQVSDQIIRLKLEDKVILGDFPPQTDSLLAGASVLVMPSQAYESFGLTIVEAMAFGVPVVTTDVGGMSEVLGDSKAGYVCSKDSPLEFATAIKSILGDPVETTGNPYLYDWVLALSSAINIPIVKFVGMVRQ